MLVYNSQTHRKQELEPIEPGKIRMYVCGPTVYDQIHIGNARTFLSFDVIRRYLSYKGYQVTFAQNLTDVDDKIINRADEQGRTAAEAAALCGRPQKTVEAQIYRAKKMLAEQIRQERRSEDGIVS